METRANYVIVGIFTLVAVMSAFVFVYWTSGVGTRTETVDLRFRIPGSASGLGRGSAVLFNGVRVGEVQRVYIDMNNPSVAIADAAISRQTPITESTQADVGLAGLTGTANIELRGGNPAEANLLELSLDQGYPAEIEANPSAVTNLLESSQSILRRADAVLADLEGFTSDARGPLTETLRNVEQFSTALGRNADGIDEFLESVGSMATTLSSASGQLESTLAAGENLITAIDPVQINEAVGNVRGFTERLETASEDFAGLMQGVDEAIGALAEFSQAANTTLLRVDAMVAEITPEMVRNAVENFEEASSRINTAAGDIAELAGELGDRTGDIDQIITDAQEIAGNLSQASRRVDDIFQRADELLASGEAEALIEDASATLEAYRNMAVSVEARVNSVLESVQDLIGSGEAEGVMSDASRTLESYRQVAETVNARIGGVLDTLEGVIGSEETQGAIAEAGETMRAFRQVADTLNASVGPITQGLNRFSNQGLREVEQLVRDSRRSISRIERAITDLERNPQRILTGGSGEVRQHDGRARR